MPHDDVNLLGFIRDTIAQEQSAGRPENGYLRALREREQSELERVRRMVNAGRVAS